MIEMDRMRTIRRVKAVAPGQLRLTWSDGAVIEVRIEEDGLGAPEEFKHVKVGDWGHSLIWPNGAELGADHLWRSSLEIKGHLDTRDFLNWRLRHGLSLSQSAEALGLSRRTVAYYSNGERRVPKAILLACLGWEASLSQSLAA